MSNTNQDWLSRYTAFLGQILTPNRLKHSLGVMQVMSELAGVYALDPEQALIAGLLHDAGKDLPLARQQRLIAEAGLTKESGMPYDLYYSLYLHGPVGAYLVQTALNITDPLILDAISMHSFCGAGANFDSPFVWCLRFADLLDPNRKPDDVYRPVERQWFQEERSRLYQVVRSGRISEAALMQTDWLIQMFEEKCLPIHPNIRRTYQDLSSRFNAN